MLLSVVASRRTVLKVCLALMSEIFSDRKDYKEGGNDKHLKQLSFEKEPEKRAKERKAKASTLSQYGLTSGVMLRVLLLLPLLS